MKTLKLKDDIYWVGSLDPELKVFDIIMYTEFGTTYNSYAVRGSEKTALFETVKAKCFDSYLEKLREINLDIAEVDYIVVDHTEPDHAGSIEMMLDLNPKINIVGSRTAIDFLKHITNREFNAIEVKDGDELSLGNKTLRFIDAKFLHWPDSMYTYLVEDKVLFSCDSFGAHYSHDTVLQSTVKNHDDYMKAFKYYYDNILGPFKPHFLKAIAKVEKLDIDMICPGHGPVLDEDPWKIVKLSKEYSTEINPNKCKTVVVPYVSAYGYTEMLAKEIAKGIEETGTVAELYDMVTADVDYVLGRLYWADGILFGSPTILGEALKPIWNLLTSIYTPMHKGKIASAFGSYGWSGEAVPDIMERLRQIKMKTFGEGLRVRFKPSLDQLFSAYDFGVNFGYAVQSGKVPDKVIIRMKREEESKKVYSWKCTVCGEIIESAEAPSICPVCGVGAEYFIKVEKEEIGHISDSIEKFLIIGASGAGMCAAEEIRKRNKNSSITVVSKEPVRGYYRPQLSKLLGKNLSLESIAIKDEAWFKDNDIKLILDNEAMKLDTNSKMVTLADDKQLEYTKLIIATGAECFMPPITGSDKKGVFTLRYLSDAENIKTYASGKKTAAVIGGGILGLETAWELKNIGLDVTVIEMADRILPRQLDNGASEVIEDIIEKSGVKFIKSAATKAIEGSDFAETVLLSDGKKISADVVVVSAGVRANISLAKEAGIETNRAIIVNEKMETNVSGVYACGDCAEYRGINYALWSEALDQGKAAGINAAGEEYEYKQIIPSTTMNAFNTSVFSIGDIGSDANVTYQVYEVKEPKRNHYQKMYFKNRAFAGGILIGDTSKAVVLMEGLEKRNMMQEMIAMLIA